MEINSETLELLERRLGENVEKRVRGRLFLAYGAAATAFLSAFGYFGYDILTNARGEMSKTVDDFKTTAAQLAEEAVKPSVEDALKAAAQAENAAKDATLRLDILQDLISSRSAKVSAQEDDISRLVASMKLQLASLQRDIGEAQKQFEIQRDNSNNLYAGAGDLEALGHDLGALAEQLGLLEQQFGDLRDASTAIVSSTGETSLDVIQQVARTYEQQAIDPGRAQELPTVYFQFAGVKRGVAEEISKRLAGLGYTMPGEERLGSAAGLKEVRYFFESDAAKARKLAADLNRLLAENKYEANVGVEDYTVYKAAKPRLGTLELWLEPVRKG